MSDRLCGTPGQVGKCFDGRAPVRDFEVTVALGQLRIAVTHEHLRSAKGHIGLPQPGPEGVPETVEVHDAPGRVPIHGAPLLVPERDPRTRHELPPWWSEDSWESYGFGQASAQGYGNYTLGRCTVPGEGILFEWVLLEPRGTVPRDLLTLRVTMHPDGKLQERQKQLHGQDAWWFDGPLAVKVPDGPEAPFVQVLDEVHEDLSEMGAAGFFLEPHQAPEWESGPVDRQYWCTPMTRDAFRKHVEQVIEKLSQGQPTSLPK